MGYLAKELKRWDKTKKKIKNENIEEKQDEDDLPKEPQKQIKKKQKMYTIDDIAR